MATSFNNYFASIAAKTVEKIVPSNKSPVELLEQNPNTFKFSDKNLTKNEILEATLLLTNKKLRIIMVSQQALLNKHYPHLSIHFFTFLICHLILAMYLLN